MQTYGLFVQGQHDTRSIRSTNEDQQRAVIAIIVVYVDSKMTYEGEITTSYCIANTPFIQVQARTKQYKRTACLSRANTTPGPYIQPTQINEEPSSSL